jgi:hypothetical protein
VLVECWIKKTACIAEQSERADDAPDKIRNLGTAGAMSGAVQCSVGGGEKRSAWMTSQKVGDWCRATSGRDCPATTSSSRELSIKIVTENERGGSAKQLHLGDMELIEK